jgi:hypothetical protein
MTIATADLSQRVHSEYLCLTNAVGLAVVFVSFVPRLDIA